MLPIFDENEAMKYVDGDRQLLLAVIAAYAEQKPQDIENLHAALASRDAKRFHRAVHNLKSSARTLGGEEAYALALQVEARGVGLMKQAPGATWDGLDQEVAALLAALERLQPELDRLVAAGA